MGKILIFLIFLIQSLIVHSQNLVINPYFEKYYHLPDLKFEFDEFYADSAFICKYWYRPKGTTPDYYHTEAMHLRYSIPYNEMGYHPIDSGNAYIGIIPFGLTGSVEPIAGELIKPLEAGKEYNVKFNYRFAKDASFYYLDKIEVFITDNIAWFETNKSFPLYNDLISPEIRSNVLLHASLVNDGNWHEMNGSFKAKGGEKYIVFGIFYQNKELSKIITEYVNNNFSIGRNMNQYNGFERKHRKHLFSPKPLF